MGDLVLGKGDRRKKRHKANSFPRTPILSLSLSLSLSL